MLNRGAIKDMLLKASGSDEDIQIADIGANLFLFTFQREEVLQMVLDKTPWYVMNKLISLQRWNSHVPLKEIVFHKVHFWVQLQELSLECMTIKCAEKILKHVGKVVEIEDPMIEGKWIRSFIRARVEIDIRQPLFTGCWIPRRNMARVWVFIKYERLQDLCFKCGIIGHEQKNCNKESVMSPLGKNVQKYSLRLGVPPAKPIKMILEEQARRRKKSQAEADKDAGSMWTDQYSLEDGTQNKELMINKERFEYSATMEALEGDGNLPPGWQEGQPEGDPSSSPFPPDHILFRFNSLRLHKDVLGFHIDRMEDGEPEEAELLHWWAMAVEEKRKRESMGRVDPNPPRVLELTQNLGEILANRELEECQATTQLAQKKKMIEGTVERGQVGDWTNRKGKEKCVGPTEFHPIVFSPGFCGGSDISDKSGWGGAEETRLVGPRATRQSGGL